MLGKGRPRDVEELKSIVKGALAARDLYGSEALNADNTELGQSQGILDMKACQKGARE